MKAEFVGDFDLTGVRVALKDANRAMASAVAAEAKNLCPSQSGKLRDSIHLVPTPNGFHVVVGDSKAAHVEFGHNTVRNGKIVGHVPPSPFLRPAIMKVAGDFGESYGEAIGGLMGEYVGGALGPVGARLLGSIGRETGAKQGRDFWTRTGEIVADALDPESKKSAGDLALEAAVHFGSHLGGGRK